MREPTGMVMGDARTRRSWRRVAHVEELREDARDGKGRQPATWQLEVGHGRMGVRTLAVVGEALE
jgi:hypothetical protein